MQMTGPVIRPMTQLPYRLRIARRLPLLLAGLLIAFGFPAWDCLAQTNSGSTRGTTGDTVGTGTGSDVEPTVKTEDREGQVVLSDEQKREIGLTSTTDRQQLTPEVKERLRRFELIRERYRRQQAALRKRLTGASTEAERDRVREVIKESRNAWLRRAAALREEARDRVRALRSRMPAMKEVLDAARDNVLESAPRKPRPGID
jgi:cell division protein FtsI/penicillin-binding protein 2